MISQSNIREDNLASGKDVGGKKELSQIVEKLLFL